MSVGVKLDSKLSSYVPAAATLLAGIDFDSLTASPFYKRHRNELNVAALNEMAERIGVDPRRDLSSALVAWQAEAPLILTRGRFNAETVEPHLLSMGSRRNQYKGQTIFGRDGQSVFFPQKDIAIGGPDQAIQSVIDNLNGGIPRSLLARIKEIPKTDQIWIVSSQGLPLERMPVRSDMQSALSNLVAYVSGLNAGITLTAGAQIHVDLLCVSATDARQVHDAIRGGIGFARLTTKDNQLAMLKLYDAIQVTYEQQNVHLRANLTPELSDQLVSLLSGLNTRGGRLMPR